MHPTDPDEPNPRLLRTIEPAPLGFTFVVIGIALVVILAWGIAFVVH